MVATNTDGTSGVMMGTGIDGRHAILIANPSLHNHRPGPMSVWADGGDVPVIVEIGEAALLALSL